MTTNYNQSGKKIVLDLINEANNTSFVEADLSFAAPVVNSDVGHPANTALTVTSTGSTSFTGSKTVYYNRMDLAVLFGGLAMEYSFDDSWTTYGDIIALINSTYGLAISAEDIAFDPLVVTGNPYIVTLTALSSSIAFRGSVDITLTDIVIIPPDDILYNQTLGSPFLSGDFMLVERDSGGIADVGDGFWNVAMAMGSNYRLGIRARDPDEALIASSSGTFNVLSANTGGGTYCIDYAVQIENMPALATYFDDDYDVKLTFTIDTDPGQQLVLTLTRDSDSPEATYRFVDEGATMTFPVDAFVNDGAVIMGHIEVPLIAATAVWPTVFPTAANNPDGTPIGIITATLSLDPPGSLPIHTLSLIADSSTEPVSYPLYSYNTSASGEATDGGGYLRMGYNNPITNFFEAEAANLVVNLRPVRAPEVGSGPSTTNGGVHTDPDIYTIADMALNGGYWRLDVLLRTKDDTPLEVFSLIELTFLDWDGAGGDTALFTLKLERDGSDLKFTNTEGMPNVTAAFMDANGSVAQFNINIANYASFLPPEKVNVDGIPVGNFGFQITAKTLDGSVTFLNGSIYAIANLGV